MLTRLPLRWVFEVLYALSRDPWKYYASTFETQRYDHMVELLGAINTPWSWKEAHVLEVGASVGAFTRRLLEFHPYQITALDISAMALRRARRLLPPKVVRLVRSNIFTDDPDGSYQLIVASDVLGYTADAQVLAATRDRLLSSLLPQGYLLLGNTKLRSEDGEGWERFKSRFPLAGANAILECFLQRAKRCGGYEEPRYRIDLLQSSPPT